MMFDCSSYLIVWEGMAYSTNPPWWLAQFRLVDSAFTLVDYSRQQVLIVDYWRQQAFALSYFFIAIKIGGTRINKLPTTVNAMDAIDAMDELDIISATTSWWFLVEIMGK